SHKEVIKDHRKLKVNGLKYRNAYATYLFKNLNLYVSPGEVVGLFGYSGAGKTTLAQIIAGYLKPDAGTVEIDGNTVSHSDAHPVQLIWQHPEKAVNPR